MNNSIYGETDVQKMKILVDLALKNSGCADRYLRRKTSNPTLACLGDLPQNLNEISNYESPWFCHGLAFRMATFSDDSDYIFERWETLLKLAQKAEGWPSEYAYWSNATDHWAKKWDKLHHFLWLLQCYEYFNQRGFDVSFPASPNQAMPDLLIKRLGQEEIYAECYFYSKWWPREFYFEHLLRKIDENLSVKRTHNIVYDASKNPFSSDKQLIVALDHLATALTKDELAKMRAAAQNTSPQNVCEIGDFRIVLKGEGEYQPSQNAHGDPAYSLPVYVNEIIEAKKNSNNLKGSRPNMLMVNALGLDFQLGLSGASEQMSACAELPCSLDEVWISACGIDRRLVTCQQVLKILRGGHSGSGF